MICTCPFLQESGEFSLSSLQPPIRQRTASCTWGPGGWKRGQLAVSFCKRWCVGSPAITNGLAVTVIEHVKNGKVHHINIHKLSQLFNLRSGFGQRTWIMWILVQSFLASQNHTAVPLSTPIRVGRLEKVKLAPGSGGEASMFWWRGPTDGVDLGLARG